MRDRLLHPLGSGSLVNLVRLVATYGCDARYAPWLVPIALACLARQPIAWAEAARFGRAISRQEIDPPPVFVIGHWRSGTTHLQNLMSADPQFARVTLAQAAMPREFLSVPKGMMAGLGALLPRHRLMDKVPVGPDVPWEEEMALTSLGRLSFYHVSFFPRAMGRIFHDAVMLGRGEPRLVAAWQVQYLHFLRKVQMVQPGRPLLLKNPANTARIALLRQMFPGARFIHIHRDPFRVFASSVHLYMRTQSAWGLQAVDRGRIVEQVLETYPVLMEACFAQSEGLGSSELAEIAFRDLQRDPLGELERVYAQLGIEGFGAAERAFRGYLESQKGYRNNRLELSEEEREAVAHRWGTIGARLGYTDADSPCGPGAPR